MLISPQVYSRPNLDADPTQWITQSGPTIDKDIPDALYCSKSQDGALRFDNVSISLGKPGGGLITRKLGPPTVKNPQSLPYARMRGNLRIFPNQWPGRIELDVKRCEVSAAAGSSIANVSNFSLQLNGSLLNSAGAWACQIDNPSQQWTATGYYFDPTKWWAEWIPYQMTYFTDYANKKFSVLTVAFGNDAPFVIASNPAAPQNNPWQVSSWQMDTVLQNQSKSSAVGVLTYDYTGIEFSMSDQPF